MRKVAVVIPVYKYTFSASEKISLRHLDRHLKNYPKIFIMPESFNDERFKKMNAQIIRFPDEYFSSVSKYSEMLLKRWFYEAFQKFEYILIYQLDALVFSDQLERWTLKGYDYIGAPWYKSFIGLFTHFSRRDYQKHVGNGGLSLRKVDSFIEVIKQTEKLSRRHSNSKWVRQGWFFESIIFQKSHSRWLNAAASDYPFNEDGFWSFEAPKYLPSFKIAPFSQGLKFSFEKLPEVGFELNHHKLPFGAHAFKKYNPDFWQPYLLKSTSSSR